MEVWTFLPLARPLLDPNILTPLSRKREDILEPEILFQEPYPGKYYLKVLTFFSSRERDPAPIS